MYLNNQLVDLSFKCWRLSKDVVLLWRVLTCWHGSAMNDIFNVFVSAFSRRGARWLYRTTSATGVACRSPGVSSHDSEGCQSNANSGKDT